MKLFKITRDKKQHIAYDRAYDSGMRYCLTLECGNHYFTKKAMKELQIKIDKILTSDNNDTHN